MMDQNFKWILFGWNTKSNVIGTISKELKLLISDIENRSAEFNPNQFSDSILIRHFGFLNVEFKLEISDSKNHFHY